MVRKIWATLRRALQKSISSHSSLFVGAFIKNRPPSTVRTTSLASILICCCFLEVSYSSKQAATTFRKWAFPGCLRPRPSRTSLGRTSVEANLSLYPRLSPWSPRQFPLPEAHFFGVHHPMVAARGEVRGRLFILVTRNGHWRAIFGLVLVDVYFW